MRMPWKEFVRTRFLHLSGKFSKKEFDRMVKSVEKFYHIDPRVIEEWVHTLTRSPQEVSASNMTDITSFEDWQIDIAQTYLQRGDFADYGVSVHAKEVQDVAKEYGVAPMEVRKFISRIRHDGRLSPALVSHIQSLSAAEASEGVLITSDDHLIPYPYLVGQSVEVTVTRISERLVTVETNDVHHRSGSIHISQIARRFVSSVHDYFKVGQVIRAKVVSPNRPGELQLSTRDEFGDELPDVRPSTFTLPPNEPNIDFDYRLLEPMLEQKFEQLPSNNGERYKHLLFLFGAIPLYEQVSKVDFTQINVPDLFASHLMNSIMLSYPPTTSDQFILSAHAIQRFGDRFGVYHMHHMFYFLQCSKLEYEDRSMCYFSYRYMLFACERRTTTDNIAYYFVITVMNSR